MIEAILLPFGAILAIGAIYFLLKSPGERSVSEFGAALQARLRLLGIFILVTGLFAAALAYRHAGSAPDGTSAIGYEVGSGYAIPIVPGEYKRDNDQMKAMGGQANVAVAEFREWFGSLWHGARLAPTLAVLSTGGFVACLLLARFLACPPPEDHFDGRPR